jgi:hypothetical protein
MLIPADDRSPYYFGAIARMNRKNARENPYHKDDSRHDDWREGFFYGKIENTTPQE